jgi:hypothetical protein
MTDPLLESVTSLSGEIATLSSRIQLLQERQVEHTTGLNLLTEVIGNLAESIKAMRVDVEKLRKEGCDRECPPEEPDTNPSFPPIRALQSTNGQ